MELATGTILHGGAYRIEKTLGQGSFGITYLATHTALNRKVAIKEFFMKELNTRGEDGSISGMTDGSLSYNYGQKFKKEAMNLSQLDHPNIVRVTDSFEENGTYYYVMDYVEGENLNEYLKHNAISQQEAVSIISDAAKALQYMHDTKHMLHLDLKPSNIMRRATDGHIFLIDFGLSKHYSNSGQPETSTTIGLGTPGYAPIEQSNQAKNGEFRPTIDVYALGATLYKLLTRETPPPASDIVSDDELVENKLRANGITGNIIDVVVNAMLPNIKKRTQTIKAFVISLSYDKLDNTEQSEELSVEDESTLISLGTTPNSHTHNAEITNNKFKEYSYGLEDQNDKNEEEFHKQDKNSHRRIIILIACVLYSCLFVAICCKNCYGNKNDYQNVIIDSTKTNLFDTVSQNLDFGKKESVFAEEELKKEVQEVTVPKNNIPAQDKDINTNSYLEIKDEVHKKEGQQRYCVDVRGWTYSVSIIQGANALNNYCLILETYDTESEAKSIYNTLPDGILIYNHDNGKYYLCALTHQSYSYTAKVKQSYMEKYPNSWIMIKQ